MDSVTAASEIGQVSTISSWFVCVAKSALRIKQMPKMNVPLIYEALHVLIQNFVCR